MGSDGSTHQRHSRPAPAFLLFFCLRLEGKTGKGRSCGRAGMAPGEAGVEDEGTRGQRGRTVPGGGSFFLKHVYIHRFRWQTPDGRILSHAAIPPLTRCQRKALAGPSGPRQRFSIFSDCSRHCRVVVRARSPFWKRNWNYANPGAAPVSE